MSGRARQQGPGAGAGLRARMGARLALLEGWRAGNPRRARRARRGAALVAGLALAAGQAPLDLPPLAFGGLMLAFFLGLMAPGPGAAAARGWLIGAGWGALTLFWIVEPFFVNPARDGWLAPFALFAMAGGLALFPALAFWLAARLAPRARTPERALALALFWSAAELLRAHALSGFPWALTAYVWLPTPIYQIAAWIGPHGLTLLTALLAALGLMALLARSGRALAGLAIAFALLWGLGGWQAARGVAERRAAAPVLRLIQPDARQDRKWDPAWIPVFWKRQLEYSAAPPAAGSARPDLVIWPEVAVPFLLSSPDAPLARIAEAAAPARVVLGAQRLGNDGRARNSLALLGPGGKIEALYDKHHLVPFGEYIPARPLVERFGLRGLAARYGAGYAPGPGPRLIGIPGIGDALPLICYEAIFPHEIRRAPARPDFLLMITNDAWFGELSGPWQHFAQARARGIEFALPVVRVANTGISAIIDARGRIRAKLGLGRAGFLDAPLPPPAPPTLYWRLGDSLALGAMIVLWLLLWRRGLHISD